MLQSSKQAFIEVVAKMAPAANAIHLAATNHAEFITLVTGKRPSLLVVGNNDEVYDKKPRRYAADIVIHTRSGKS